VYKLIFPVAALIQFSSSGDRGGRVPISQNNNFSCSKWWKGATTKSKSDNEIMEDHFMHKNPIQLVQELLSSNNNSLSDRPSPGLNEQKFLSM